jgi:hypothetical protein
VHRVGVGEVDGGLHLAVAALGPLRLDLAPPFRAVRRAWDVAELALVLCSMLRPLRTSGARARSRSTGLDSLTCFLLRSGARDDGGEQERGGEERRPDDGLVDVAASWTHAVLRRRRLVVR